MATILGLDIGGANLKAAHSEGLARSQPFALWKNPTGLADALRNLIQPLPAFDELAITMTGELCDCFATKREGVNAILDAVAAVANGMPMRVWSTGGRFVDVAAARAEPLRVAAANWHALATFACRFISLGTALLIDVGSTTTDIIPLANGRPTPKGLTDMERLQSSELVYHGIRRTPICALVVEKVAAELFATTLDAYLLLGMIPEDPADCDTADGRPATRLHAHARLARMMCADVETFSLQDAQDFANNVMLWQMTHAKVAVEEVAKRLHAPPSVVIGTGAGEFLIEPILQTQKRSKMPRLYSFHEHLGPDISKAACAHAVAILAKEATK